MERVGLRRHGAEAEGEEANRPAERQPPPSGALEAGEKKAGARQARRERVPTDQIEKEYLAVRRPVNIILGQNRRWMHYFCSVARPERALIQLPDRVFFFESD